MYDVVISGGGPVGLGLAIDLGQRGIRTAVIERNETPARIPKGQNLTQRTMEHMRAWGVEDDIRAAKTIPRGVGLGGLTAYGTLLSGYHYDWFKRAAVGQFYGADNERLPQYATEAVLRARVAGLGAVDTFFGWESTDIDTDATAVSISRAGQTRILEGRYLVGCDGSRSLVRSAVGIRETRRDHDRQMVLVVFESPAFFDLLSRFPDKQFYNVLHPDLDGYWMFFGMVDWGKTFFFHAPVPPNADRDSFDFKSLIHRAVGDKFPLELDYVGFWDLRISHADTYQTGSVFIAGDAAHSHPPYGGYGINTGFEDARNLGWKLAATIQGWGGQALLDSYTVERHPVFATTARDFIERFIADDRAFVRAHNPEIDRPDFEAAWAARAQTSEAQGISTFAPHYGGSPVVVGAHEDQPSAVGTHDFAARPGHHLSPQKLQDGTTLDCFANRFAVFVSDLDTGPLREASDTRGIPLDIFDVPEGVADAHGHSAVLVRPDGYVAWVGNSLDDFSDILDTVAG
jgi:2-polyprenyl-6-methoxyphenol hydroxylase-like FAD-dependent oxidoreductase